MEWLIKRLDNMHPSLIGFLYGLMLFCVGLISSFLTDFFWLTAIPVGAGIICMIMLPILGWIEDQ